ncbi:ABC1 family-domain-containing protein [Pelagophyceae sp. CCMP2097]|nr:ABC1 family-domain-containing protein [Pelagophyceae sp. CCMP2097]
MSLRVAAAAAASSATAYFAFDRREDVRDALECSSRAANVARCAVATIADYRMVNDADIGAAHERAALRFRGLADAHGGIFVKLGQHVASLTKAVPQPFIDHLSGLRDSARASDPDRVRALVQQELGGSWPFLTWEREPLASASIAQVHAATTLDGYRVAVKVVHPGLARRVRLDLMTIKAAMRVSEAVFSRKEVYGWVLPDFEEALSNELDLVQEASTMARCGTLLEELHVSGRRIKVPKVRWDLTTTNVLTSELVLDARRVDEAPPETRRAVAAELVAAHAFLSLQCGLVHADPHGANAMIADKANGDWDLYIIDFGLCRRLEPGFRRGLCGMWRALATRDDDGINKHALALGIDAHDASILFASANKNAPIGTPPDIEAMKADIMRRIPTLDAVSEYMASLPRDLLFVLRSVSLLRSVSRDLGLTSRERYIGFALAATRGTALPHAADYTADLCDAGENAEEERRRLRLAARSRVQRPNAHINREVDAELFMQQSTMLSRTKYRLSVIKNLTQFACSFAYIELRIRARLFAIRIWKRYRPAHQGAV